jgi:hypothetical protein
MDLNKRYLLIENNGEIEEGGLVLMGASTKESDASKIGFFGSGNKYAIATLLREKVPFFIFSGLTKVTVNTKTVSLSEEKFEQIIINRKRTSLTTRMGPDWKIWYALREFVANAMDEEDYFITTVDHVKPYEGHTSIFIEMTDEVKAFVRDFSHIFSQMKDPIFVTSNNGSDIRVYEAENNGMNIYRKHISVSKQNDVRMALWWYDIDSLEINESRVYQYEYQVLENIARALSQLPTKEMVIKFLRCLRSSNPYIEKDAYWQYIPAYEGCMTDAWKEAIGDREVYPESVAQFFGATEDKIMSVIVPDSLAVFLSKAFPEMNVIGHTDRPYKETTFSPDFEHLLAVNHRMLVQAGIIGNIFKALQAVEVEDTRTLGWYDQNEDKIFVVENNMEHTDLEVQMLLIEEYIHTQGYQDGSREFVNYLINQIIQLSQDKLKLAAIEDMLHK